MAGGDILKFKLLKRTASINLGYNGKKTRALFIKRQYSYKKEYFLS